MRACVRSILVIMVLGSASAVLAQQPDAGSEPEQDAGTPEAEPEKEREPFVKRDGQRPDNEQLGGEPSLTEVDQATEAGAEAQVEGTEGCDLDCIEAELEKEKQKQKRLRCCNGVLIFTGLHVVIIVTIIKIFSTC